jgi:endonuclease YncB( thermonuclease family)
MSALIFLAALLFPAITLAADLSGPVTITDGDTLRFGDVRVRLIGMDALEARQTCKLDGEHYPCGAAITSLNNAPSFD